MWTFRLARNPKNEKNNLQITKRIQNMKAPPLAHLSVTPLVVAIFNEKYLKDCN